MVKRFEWTDFRDVRFHRFDDDITRKRFADHINEVLQKSRGPHPFPSLSMIKRVQIQNPGAIYKEIEKLQRTEAILKSIADDFVQSDDADCPNCDFGPVTSKTHAPQCVYLLAHNYFGGPDE